jgi:dTDP-glucose pyrophosphorylase/CBS domain-containing protein
MADLTGLLVAPSDSIRRVMSKIDSNSQGIALVVDAEGRLLYTVTDGDIRRALLAGFDLDRSVQELARLPRPARYTRPVTAPAGTPEGRLVQMMKEAQVRQIPLVDDSGRVKDVALLDDLVSDLELPVTAVVMAGGFGTRLRPLTEDLPKPMLPVGGRPLMELTIEQLRRSGIRKVNVTTHYKAEKISNHFGDGAAYGVEITYVPEHRPLGTAGGIGLLSPSKDTLLVINGDILTSVDYGAMLAYHREHDADLTVAVRKYDFQVPYGVVESEGARVKGLTEKPSYSFFVNAGIYLLEPAVQRYMSVDKPMDMTDLIEQLLKDRRVVVSFLIREYWLDIGHMADYQQAQRDEQAGKMARG